MNRFTFPSVARTMPFVVATGFFIAASTGSALAAELPQTGPTVSVTGPASPPTPDERDYVAAMHAHLQAAMRQPTGREASLLRPVGTAAVWVILDSDGRVKGRGVERSSGAPLLDEMATRLVGRARYEALPVGRWTESPTHRFLVKYRFTNGDASDQAAVTIDDE